MPLTRMLPPLCLLLCGAMTASADDETAYDLTEPADNSRPVHVTYRMSVAGKLEERVPGSTEAVTSHDLTSKAQLDYTERRLPAAGARADALRSLRYFDSLRTDVKVGDHPSELQLPPKQRLFVVRGAKEELRYYGLSRLLTARELELLQIPFDTVAALALLPPNEVQVGESWKPETWALHLLTGVEAVLKGELTCKLAGVESNLATVEFQGKLEGGRLGAKTEIEFTGKYQFDLGEKRMVHLEARQKENSSISPVAPGLDVSANIQFDRKPADPHPQLTDARLASVPLDPDPTRLLLVYNSPWGTQFVYDRHWHIIQGKYVVLRLMINGSLISQGTMMGLKRTVPGQHVSEKQFQKDIRNSLGERLKRIESAEQIESGDGRFLYRATATGTSQGRDLVWRYYLCAHPDGRQVSFVFSTEENLIDTLGERDLDIIRSIKWPKAQSPAAANQPE